MEITPRFNARRPASLLRTVAVLGGLALSAASGCSPQEKSYYLGKFTPVPDPPKNARMQLGTSTENDGTLFINYVVWDESDPKNPVFKRKDIHYSTTGLHPGTYSEQGGYEQRIRHGETLYGGAVVDQAKGRILLDGGRYIEGTTGSTFDKDGKLLLELKDVQDLKKAGK